MGLRGRRAALARLGPVSGILPTVAVAFYRRGLRSRIDDRVHPQAPNLGAAAVRALPCELPQWQP